MKADRLAIRLSLGCIPGEVEVVEIFNRFIRSPGAIQIFFEDGMVSLLRGDEPGRQRRNTWHIQIQRVIAALQTRTAKREHVGHDTKRRVSSLRKDQWRFVLAVWVKAPHRRR